MVRSARLIYLKRIKWINLRLNGRQDLDKQDIGVIGAGSWGIALAYLLANNGHDVTVWSRSESTVEKLKNYHGNEDKLPGVKLPESVVYTSDIKTAVENKDLLVYFDLI